MQNVQPGAQDRGIKIVREREVSEAQAGRQFAAERPNQKSIADFTDIWTTDGWLYVSAVICSLPVVGWSMRAEL
jgi:transposase InsO family protein